MQIYESVFITNPALSDEELEKTHEKLKQVIEQNNGELLEHYVWGKRRLAYLVKKQTHGVYHVYYMKADNEILAELHRQYRYLESVLKFQTIRIEDWKKELEYLENLSEHGSRHNAEEDLELDLSDDDEMIVETDTPENKDENENSEEENHG